MTPLRIGLLNLMPDAAVGAAERQFGDLVRSAADQRGAAVEIAFFHLPSQPRTSAMAERMGRRCADAVALLVSNLDALIVTGGEPSGPDLRAEPYWSDLIRVIDWAWSAGVPALWSCMAAHAAVLHLDGIERRPLARKLSGVFALSPASAVEPLGRITAPLIAPHSRGNTLETADLVRAGYDILTHSPAVGADTFLKRGEGLFLFTHGHPEYGAEVLALEYRRDVRRFLTGERPRHPDLPSDYFDPVTAQRLGVLAEAAMRDPSPQLCRSYDAVLATHAPAAPWRPFAADLYAGWLDAVIARAADQPRRASAASKAAMSAGGGVSNRKRSPVTG